MQITYKNFLLLSLFVSTIISADTKPGLTPGSKPSTSGLIFQPKPSIEHPQVLQGSPLHSGDDFPTDSMPADDLNLLPNQSDELKDLIVAQLKDIRAQDLSKAYYAFMSADFQKIVPLDTFKLFLRTSPGFVKNRSFEVQNVSFSGVVVTVKGVLTDATGRQTLVQYDFIQENGQWKIRKLELIAPSGT